MPLSQLGQFRRWRWGLLKETAKKKPKPKNGYKTIEPAQPDGEEI